jgi:hypothetical protein
MSDFHLIAVVLFAFRCYLKKKTDIFYRHYFFKTFIVITSVEKNSFLLFIYISIETQSSSDGKKVNTTIHYIDAQKLYLQLLSSVLFSWFQYRTCVYFTSLAIVKKLEIHLLTFHLHSNG